MNELGHGALWLALLAAILAAGCAASGGAFRRSSLVGRAGQLFTVAALLLSTSVVALIRSLLVSDFSLRYVASVSSLNLQALYKLVGLWAGPPGTLLLWATLLAVMTAIAMRQLVRRAPALVASVGATLGAVLIFSIVLCALQANPFDLLSPAPEEGLGLSPLLQTAAAALVTPLLLVGMSCASVGITIAAVALFQHQELGDCLGAVRVWGAGALVALAAGLTVGASTPVAALESGAGTSGALSIAALVFAFLALWVVLAGSARSASRLAIIVGVALFGLIAAASLLRVARDASLRDGETISVRDAFRREWTFASQGLSRFRRPPNQYVRSVSVAPRVGGARRPLITAEQRDYVNSVDQSLFEPAYFAGTQSGFLQDVRFTIVELQGGAVKVQLAFLPLLSWRWPALLLVVIGALSTLVRRPTPRVVADAAADPAALDDAAEAAVHHWRQKQVLCGACGAPTDTGARYCTECGRRLDG